MRLIFRYCKPSGLQCEKEHELSDYGLGGCRVCCSPAPIRRFWRVTGVFGDFGGKGLSP